MAKKEKNNSLPFLIIYLIASLFGGLAFSIFALRAKNRNKTVFWWFLLALIFIGFFGTIAYSLFITSGPAKDKGYYYLAIITLITNALALLILIKTLFTKSIDYGTN